MEYSLFEATPYLIFHKTISGKWFLPILKLISENETLRFGELHRLLPKVSKATLAKDLNFLVHSDILAKASTSTYPKKSEYFLTSNGKEFMDIVNRIDRWSSAYISRAKACGKELPFALPDKSEEQYLTSATT